MRFATGDRVYYTSGVHRKGAANPLKGTEYECIGTVSATTSYHCLVKWDNGTSNTYSPDDLDPADDLDTGNPNLKFRFRKKR